MRLTCVDAIHDAIWDRFTQSRSSSLFHSSPWLGSLAAAYGFRPQAYLLSDGDTPTAGLPFCRIADLRGERLVAAPFSDFCDPLMSAKEQWRELFEALRVSDLPLTFRWRDHDDDTCKLSLARRARWHGVSLDAGLDRLWARLAPSARRAVRKAARDGIEVRPLDANQLSEFVRLHATLRKRKYRLLAQPFAFFDAVRARFDAIGGWFPLAAVHRSRVVAVTIFLRWRDELYYKFNASCAASLPLRPNDALMWEGIRLGHRLGCSRLDLGASDIDQPGLIHFKRHYATDERDIRQYSYQPDRNETAPSPHTVLRRITEVATAPAVPDPLTRLAGTLLYRYFV